MIKVYRRVGGLENSGNYPYAVPLVYRRVGGLETTPRVGALSIISLPPCRRYFV